MSTPTPPARRSRSTRRRRWELFRVWNYNIGTNVFSIAVTDTSGSGVVSVTVHDNVPSGAVSNFSLSLKSGSATNGIWTATLPNDNINNHNVIVTMTINAGTITIGNSAMLPLSGIIDNTGTIAINSMGTETDLQIIEHGITLQGHGQVVLSDSAENVISGTGSDVTLTNVDNTNSGTGQLGVGQLTLINEGTIDATGSTHSLSTPELTR
jgi:hypothetical protein